MFAFFRRFDSQREAGRALFQAIARQARMPVFHKRYAVPDTIDGRFDLLALHGFLAMEALKGCGKKGEIVGTHLATAIFESLEEALRELGVGDIGISRRIKAMANAFYGRLSVYSAAKDETAMREALLRNLFRSESGRELEADVLSHYMLESLAGLTAMDRLQALLAGEIRFAQLPD